MDCSFNRSRYIKTEDNRTIPIRFDRVFSLDEEFNALRGMYSTFPDNENNPIVKSYSLSPGKMSLELVKGKTLAQMMNEVDQEILKVIDLVDTAVTRIHANGWAHGDLREENILYISETKRIKLIDPVGYAQYFDLFPQAKSTDLSDLERIRETCQECLLPRIPPSYLELDNGHHE